MVEHLSPSTGSGRENTRLHVASDANAAFRAFSRKHGIAHRAVRLRAGVWVRRHAGALHVQDVKALHQRLRDWLARFRGVASRYLPHYLGWHRVLDGAPAIAAEQFLRIAIGLINRSRRQRLLLCLMWFPLRA
ncbi:hypothetical protein IM543_09535 [Massilia sp. UMI-21]|nr:hypothetical protein IM543_09535 [Massilia sp. UMI-21]